ncbi:hypothetical protein V8G54_035933 [Vigna mungo]|uniref:Uncharacterized protein n=1 Tax=Vigna mungo TaxID=3915 RepID=A0AAQ3MHI2_VIGMU
MVVSHQQPHFTPNGHRLLFPLEATHSQARRKPRSQPSHTTRWWWLPDGRVLANKEEGEGISFSVLGLVTLSLCVEEEILESPRRFGCSQEKKRKGGRGRERVQLFLKEEGNETLLGKQYYLGSMLNRSKTHIYASVVLSTEAYTDFKFQRPVRGQDMRVPGIHECPIDHAKISCKRPHLTLI